MSRAEGPKDLRSEEQVRRSEALLAAGQRLRVTGSFSWNVVTDEITWSDQLYRIYELTSAPLATRHRDESLLTGKRSLVAIVDDDESVRESLPDLLRQLGFAAEAFSSPEAFLASDLVNETSCLLLDVTMPGMSGPDLQHELTRRRQPIPIVFITASGDRTLRSRLLAKGAVECLFKPFSETALLDALNAALRIK